MDFYLLSKSFVRHISVLPTSILSLPLVLVGTLQAVAGAAARVPERHITVQYVTRNKALSKGKCGTVMLSIR